MTEPQFVIWSEEHGAWWAPNSTGYIRSLHFAGRYSQEKAEEIVRRANSHLRDVDTFHEIAIADPLFKVAD